jgi:hypothetical protein
MVEVERPCHALHVARLEQKYAGHGIVVQPVLQRGFIGAQERPESAASRSPQRKASRMVIHVHLRERVLSIQCGEGKQRVFWLAVNAVQRYLTDLGSYSHVFSAEMTPKAVVSESLEFICKTGRICDKLKDSDHVWVDVGDEKPISSVNSRAFGNKKILEGDECVACPRRPASSLSDQPAAPVPRPYSPIACRARLRKRSRGSERAHLCRSNLAPTFWPPCVHPYHYSTNSPPLSPSPLLTSGRPQP